MINQLSDDQAERAIKLVADDVWRLRRVDVDRVLMEFNGDPAMLAVWIVKQRPALQAECRSVLHDEGLMEANEFDRLVANTDWHITNGQMTVTERVRRVRPMPKGREYMQ